MMRVNLGIVKLAEDGGNTFLEMGIISVKDDVNITIESSSS